LDGVLDCQPNRLNPLNSTEMVETMRFNSSG